MRSVCKAVRSRRPIVCISHPLADPLVSPLFIAMVKYTMVKTKVVKKVKTPARRKERRLRALSLRLRIRFAIPRRYLAPFYAPAPGRHGPGAQGRSGCDPCG